MASRCLGNRRLGRHQGHFACIGTEADLLSVDEGHIGQADEAQLSAQIGFLGLLAAGTEQLL
jgi:hypothetical protein